MKPFFHKRVLLKLSAPAVLLLFTGSVALAQEQERPRPDWENMIETDGPDFTEASSVVPKGTFQVETGVVFTSDKAAGATNRNIAYPATLLRYGLLPSLELRFIGQISDDRSTIRSGSPEATSTVTGLAPFLTGVKIFICEEKGLRPEASFIGHLVLPTGSRSYRPRYTASQFRFSLSNTLSDRFDLGYNFGYEWDGFSTQGQAIYTLALGYTISRRWSIYTELYGDKPETEAFAHAAAGGVKFFLAPNWQMDVSGGHGITEEANDYYFAYGLRFRLPY